MQGFLLRSIQRRLQRMALGAAFGMAVVTTTALFAGGFGDPTTGEAGIAAHKADSCENPGERTTVASRVGPQVRVAGTALSCAGGDLYLGDGDRPDRKAGSRTPLKQQN